MRTPPQRYRRSVLDLSRSQAGDVSARDAAGRDIYHGLDGATLLRLLEGQAHERALVAASIERLSEQLRGHELMQAKRDEIDGEERAARQSSLDAELARIRRWLILLTLFLLGVVAVEAALVARELALFARAGYDVALSARP